MKLHYDFHLHSCLSPCGDGDMTPHNLVQMAKLLGFDVIALTDHNSCGNCAAAMRVGEGAGITVLPGMELCTAEEIHVVCLFSELKAAVSFSDSVRETLPPVRNKPQVFGNQFYMDAQDGILGEEETLLVTASSIMIDEVKSVVESFGGFCYPAHIDRSSFSVTASLGAIPPELGFTCAEVSPAGDLAQLRADYPALNEMTIMRSSDAHYLENMTEPAQTIDPESNTPQAVLDYLKSL